jgi:hypothetical protein
MSEQQQQGEDPAAADRTAAPNTTFLSKYLKGLDSGNKRAIARNAARGAQQVTAAQSSKHSRSKLQDQTYSNPLIVRHSMPMTTVHVAVSLGAACTHESMPATSLCGNKHKLYAVVHTVWSIII